MTSEIEKKVKVIKEKVKELCGYEFNNDKILLQAFIDNSYVEEHKNLQLENYQVMELFGDSILDFIVFEFILDLANNKNGFIHFNYDQGELTFLKSLIVCKESQAMFIENSGLSDFMLMGKGADTKENKHLIKKQSDLYESLLFAIWLDSKQNIKVVKKFVEKSLYVSKTIDVVKNEKIFYAYEKSIENQKDSLLNPEAFLSDELNDIIRNKETSQIEILDSYALTVCNYAEQKYKEKEQ